MKKWLPWICVAVFAVWFLSGASSPKITNGFDSSIFGRLPVLLNGRIQPFDTVARNALLSMRGKSTIFQDGASMTASEWALEAMTRPELADTRKIFQVRHPDLDALLGSRKEGIDYFSFNDVAPQLPKIEEQVQNLARIEGDREEAVRNRTYYQKDLLHLYNSVALYHQIKNSLAPEGNTNFAADITAFQATLGPALDALKKQEAAETFDREALQRIAPWLHEFQDLAADAYPLAVPSQAGGGTDAWRNMGQSLLEAVQTGKINPAALKLAAIGSAYAANRPQDYGRAVAEYESWLRANGQDNAIEKARREFLFNQLEPFYKAMVIYIAALLFGCVAWINMSEGARKTGFLLLALAFAIHTLGLGWRMWLEGRPPVTNLYSSAVFIGWGAVLLGLILERIYKGAIGMVAAAVAGFATLIIAHHLSLDGDTMQMLVAVLDSNFWLTTHVVAIAIGNSSTFLAGLLGAMYILGGFFTQRMSAPAVGVARPGETSGAALARMVYGIVCFSTLFSFVGTVLGGIWADQSWGRFWGWDPKENGALLIVLWNAIILHARWAKLIRERGLMVMAVLGNIVTSFSWFGVNMLGVGLHSYGFMDSAFAWLMAFMASQLAIAALGCAPLRAWASFRDARK